MRGVPIAICRTSFLLGSLVALSGAQTNEPISDNIELNLKSRRPLTEVIVEAQLSNRGFTEDRLKADGFLEDKHSQSALEHDLTNKLRAIYERYYELSDKLHQAEGNSGELTKQLMQTKLDLANYKVYKNDLISRLKKTEMYLTVLLKKSQYHVEEHHINLNPDLYEEVADEIARVAEPEEKQVLESRMATLTNGNATRAKEITTKVNDATMRLSETLNIESHLDTDPHDVSVAAEAEKTVNKAGGSDTPSMDTSGVTETVGHDSQGNITISNGTTKDDVLTDTASSFLRKKPSKSKIPEGPTLRGGFFDGFTEHVNKSPSGPFVKNITVVLRGAPKRKGNKGVSLTDWNFGIDIGNTGIGVFFDSFSDYDQDIRYKYIKGERGSPGLPGISGTTGPQGPPGAQGNAGAPGLVGTAGPRGEPGFGVPGVNGVNGVAGVQGAQGFTGPSGAPGLNGAPGLKGVTGVQGPMGARGPKGGVGDR